MFYRIGPSCYGKKSFIELVPVGVAGAAARETGWACECWQRCRRRRRRRTTTSDWPTRWLGLWPEAIPVEEQAWACRMLDREHCHFWRGLGGWPVPLLYRRRGPGRSELGYLVFLRYIGRVKHMSTVDSSVPSIFWLLRSWVRIPNIRLILFSTVCN